MGYTIQKIVEEFQQKTARMFDVFFLLGNFSGREMREVLKELPKMMQNHMNEFKSYTVDGRNPAPPGIYKTCSKMAKTIYL